MSDIRTPPGNAEAERSVLGSILLNAIGRNEDRIMDICVSEGITEESFLDPRNRVVYATMLGMNRNSKPIDGLSLVDELGRLGKLDAIGGGAYVTALIDQVPTTAHAEYYISIMKNKHLRRMMIERSNSVINKCYDENEYPDPQVVLGFAEKTFLEIGDTSGKTMPWGAAIEASFERIDRMFESRGRSIAGLSTGLTHLDERLQGLKKSEMIVIAARPSVGKTSLAMNIAESCALGLDMNNSKVKYDGGKKHPVGIFSLEMPIEALTQRMISGRAKVNMWKVNRGFITKTDRAVLTESLTKAVGELKGAPIYVDDSAGLDIMDLRARARRMKKQHDIELIVIDYLQLCTCREAARQGSRQIEVSMISQQIKAMAKELKIPVIVLSQLSRANEQRGDKEEKPKLSDLRDSGAIEQDADVVFLLRRPSRSEKSKEAADERLAIIDVAKNRNGETGEVRVNFIREYTRFEDRPIEGHEGEENNKPVDDSYAEEPMIQGELAEQPPIPPVDDPYY